MNRFDVKALVFDLDGVLVDSEALNVRSAFEAFEAFGLRLEPADAGRIVGVHPMDYVPAFAARFGLSETKQAELRRFQNDIYLRLWKEVARPTDGARETVDALRAAGRRLALATSAGRRHAADCLERMGIAGAFELVLTKDDVDRRKPDPQIYLECARRLALAPREMLVVEDSPVGVQAAVEAGALCVAIRSPHIPVQTLGRAHAVLDDLAALPGILA